MVSTVGSDDTQTTDTQVRSTPYTKISNEFATNPKADSARDLILPTDYSIWTRSLHRQGQLDTIIRKKMFIFRVKRQIAQTCSFTQTQKSSNQHLIRIMPPPPPRGLTLLNVGKNSRGNVQQSTRRLSVGLAEAQEGKKHQRVAVQTCPLGLRERKGSGSKP